MRCDDKRGAFRLSPMVLPLLLALTFIAGCAWAAEGPANLLPDAFSPVEIHGFFEARAGVRTQKDPHEKESSVMEARFQLELFTSAEWAEIKYKGDAWADGVTEKGEYDTRELRLFSRPVDCLDITIGRQVLTWGTGDLVFLNDLFPKDWQSYFIGRDKEYLKAPSDAARIGFFTDSVNMDVVYTPRFDSDRYITGEYISHWDSARAGLAGRGEKIAADTPDRWFRDDETAVRAYGTIDNYELAVYGYWGFWKRPAGRTPSGEAAFPALHVYGASARGRLGPGIGNLELAYYRSVDDKSGSNPRIDNSEMRWLVGYAMDPARDLSASLQYYVEQLLDYGEYRAGLAGGPARDRLRSVITLQLTKLSMNQNLELSLCSYYSPSDNDALLRPNIHYKYSDDMALETGANLFFGEEPHTFFGQFEKNTNVYAAVRYSF